MKLLVSLLVWSSLLLAQTFQATLRGRVTDPGGAPTPDVKVTLVNEATSVPRTTLTNDAGEYVFTAVDPALYRVSAEGSGFKRVEQRNVQVATQAALTVDIRLELGQVTDQVTVSVEVPPLEATDASVGQVIDTKKITDLPILGRNPFYFGKLAQTVVFAGNPKFARMQDQNANAQVSIGGGPLRTNNYLVDGISITDSQNRAVIIPSPEAVQELKLQASTYDGEVGRTGGGTFNTLLRSGTNEIHGSAFGHLRQTEWLANDFFANRAGRTIADQPYRDWGASLGGPVRIPKLYDGRNRTFVFAATEAYRQKDGSTTLLAVPTALERRGDFSQSLNRAGTLQTIYDPNSTTATGARTPFAGNVIPAARINSVGNALASYYAQPNQPTPFYGANNLAVTGNYPNRGNQFIGKADHQFASWLRLSASYIYQRTFETAAPNLFGNPGSPSQGYCCDRKVNATQANATLTPSATTVVAVRWGFNRLYSRSTQASQGFNLASLGLPASLVAATTNPAFPAITMGDLSSFGGGGAAQDVFYSRNFVVTLSKFQGKHSLKAGFERRLVGDAGTPTAGPSSFTFNDIFTRPNPSTATVGQGSSFAALLLGVPSGGSMNVVTNFDNYLRYYGGFVHDDYRLTSKLILNFGARFEHETGLQDRNNRLIVGFDRNAPNPIGQNTKGIVQYAGVNGAPLSTFNPKTAKISPRFGFAYSWNPKTVFRGGYGIFWAPTYFNYQNTIGYSQSTDIIASTNGNATPASPLSNPYPNGLLQPTGNALGGLSGIGQAISITDPQTRSAGYVQQASLEVQRQLPGGFTFTAGLLGSRSIGLLRPTAGPNINQLDPVYFSLGSALTAQTPNPFFNNGGVGTIGTANVQRNQLLRPFPQFTSVALLSSDNASARYYSYYFRGERRFANGFSVLASYTWSRSTDDITGATGSGANQVQLVSGPQSAYHLAGERILSTQHVPHRFTAAFTYELPFGRGQRYLNSHRLVDWTLGGWSVNGIGTWQSGFPIFITQPNNNSVIGANHQRPNATGLSAATSGSTTDRIDGWLNPAAFSQAPQYTFGNISRFLNLRGPSTSNVDVSIFKTLAIRERIRAQFRAEALNAANTPIFGIPNTTFTNAQFGQITSQVNNPRLIQLGLRVTF